MKTKILGLITLFLMTAAVVFAGEKSEKFKVYGNCGMCEKTIEKAAKSVNQEICDLLKGHQIDARAVTDTLAIEGNRKKAIRAVVDGRVRVVRDDYSGSISGVNGKALLEMLEAGQIPVLPPMAISEDGLLNVDGDRASASVAAELNADTLLILSNVAGLYRDFEADDAPVSEIPANKIEQAMEWAQGRMKRKVLGAQEALEGGVRRVIIGDGRISNPVSQALSGQGTQFLSEQYVLSARG